jgi:hypothetical protein
MTAEPARRGVTGIDLRLKRKFTERTDHPGGEIEIFPAILTDVTGNGNLRSQPDRVLI